ncbi:amino acid adenylation domain-containing protein [Streptomyces fuscichromogenes]|uniref:non-ribosomal peptide synthetase n=1 Tax=Streptomyces fuscichromogenes TaxID=1324013 RepID=UPI0038169090
MEEHQTPHSTAPPSITPYQADLLSAASTDTPARECLQVVCRFEGPVDLEALEAGWRFGTDRHPGLRTAWTKGPHGWTGEVRPPSQAGPPALVEQLPPTGSGADPERALEEFLTADAARPFALGTGHPYRISWLTGDSGHGTMVWSVHPAAVDEHGAARVLADVLGHYDVVTGVADTRAEATDPAARAGGPEAETNPGDPGDPEADRAYWTAYLAATEPQTQAGFARTSPKAPQDGSRRVSATLVLDAGLCERLAAQAARTGVPRHLLVTAAWALVLSRTGAGGDVVLGETLRTRPEPAAGSTPDPYGPALAELPLHVPVPHRADLDDWVRALHDSGSARRLHRAHPRPELPSDASAPARLCVVDRLPAPLDSVAGGPGPRHWHVRRHRAAPLVLEIGTEDAAVAVRLDGSADLFDRAGLDRALTWLRTALDALPDGGRVGEVTLLDSAERQSMVSRWNRTERPVETRPVHELVDRVADRERPAVGAGGTVLTYGELIGRSDRLAWHLNGLGVRRGDTVGVRMGRSPEVAVALLGVLKAGAAYLPLDPGLPPGRAEFMIADSGVRVLLTDVASATEATPGVRTVVLDGTDASAVAGAEPVELPVVTGSDLAYVIYTSGSTGTPKGVAVEHRCLTDLSRTQIREFELVAADRALQVASLSFDVSVEEIFPTLLRGARLEISPSLAKLAPEDLLSLVEAAGITVLNLPTAYWHHLVRALKAGATMPHAVRLVVIGGESVDLGLVGVWHELGVKARLMNGYGPTEATVTATMMEMHADDALRRLVIGRPLDNVRTYVLDTTLQPVPVGVTGELHLGGPRVARGYTGQPALTASRFVADPFAAPGTYMYRTGDLVRWRDDGVLEFIGRADGQVKIRGFRVDTGEIEAALLAHPRVGQAVVTAPDDRGGTGRRLVGYVSGLDGRPAASDEDLRDWLAARLPAYMVPEVFVALAEFPTTVSGKLDRRALPEPAGGRPRLSQAYVAPRTDTEKALAAVWAETLGWDQVGVHDNFFDLGGTSMLILTVRRRLKQAAAFGDVSVADLFGHATIAELADHLDGRSGPGTAAEPAGTSPRGEDRRRRLAALRGARAGEAQGKGMV